MLRVCLVALVLFGSAAGVEGQNPPPPASMPAGRAQQEKPVGSVIGRISLADTNVPARGVRVLLIPIAEHDELLMNWSGMTNLEGVVTFPRVPVGNYVLAAFAAGYVTAAGDLPGKYMERSVRAKAYNSAIDKRLGALEAQTRVTANQTARVALVLQRGAVMTGKVIYGDGSPGLKLPVFLEHVRPEGAPASVLEGSATLAESLRQKTFTDDEGNFRIAGISAGLYRIAVAQSLKLSPGLDTVETAPVNIGDALTFYSGDTVSEAQAKVYDVSVGEKLNGLVIKMDLDQVHSVSGIATGRDGVRLNAGDVELVNVTDHRIYFFERVGANGEFSFQAVPAGSYELKATDGFLFDRAGFVGVTRAYLELAGDKDSRPLRAFADTSVPVTVLNGDVENLTILMDDAKLPRLPK